MLPQYGGKVSVDKERNSVVKMLRVPGEEDDEFWRAVAPRLRLSHPNLAELRSLTEVGAEAEGCCGPATRTYRLEYELLTYSLFHEIQHYCKIKQPFPEAEICRIFEGVVRCLEYLQGNGTLHGDIKVSNIFMDSHQNVKIMDAFFLKEGRTNYETVLEDPKSMSLLSPEQLELLRVKLFDSLVGMPHSEIFMVGLTMLEVATIREGMRCYNLETLTINEEFFMCAMRDIQDCGYSYQLSNLIMNCVHKLPQRRPTYGQLLRDLQAVKQAALLPSP
jgi:serine/threonine protein kinase